MDIMYFRGSERIIICVIAGFSIWCGYSLFKLERVQSVTGGNFDATVGPLKISLKKVWPGVFFAAFGMLVLAVSVVTQASTQKTNADGSGETKYAFSVQLTDQLKTRLSVGANALAVLQVILRSSDAQDLKDVKLAALSGPLDQLKGDLIDAIFGDNSYVNYITASSVSGGLAGNTSLSEQDRKKYQDIDNILHVTAP